MKILIVDDDLALADVLSFTVRRDGYDVITAHDGRTALMRWEEEYPDLIILDINLPKLNGLEVCQAVRQKSDTPIIFLSVRGEEDDIVKGLKLGADDYIVKPFSPRQLVARVEAVLRRAHSETPLSKQLSFHSYKLDASSSQLLTAHSEPIKLTVLEYKFLEILFINQGHALSADQLIDHIWGPGLGDKQMLKQLVYRVRKKIDLEAGIKDFIETLGGVGYSLSHKNK